MNTCETRDFNFSLFLINNSALLLLLVSQKWGSFLQILVYRQTG